MTGWTAAHLSAPASRGSGEATPGATAAMPRRHVRRTILNWLVVIVPVLAELLVGGYQIGRASLWRDEGYTREVVQRPMGAIISLLGHQDAVHGLYYVGMHLVVAALGTSATAIRLPSLIATSLAAGLTAALGRRLARAAAQPAASVTGLLAGLLLVALPLTTWYAQDARPYAMATLSAVGATYLFVRGVTGRSRWWWAGYAVAVAILALLNLTALLLVAAHGVSLLIMRARVPAADRTTGEKTAGEKTAGDQTAGEKTAGEKTAGDQTAGQLRAATRRWLVATAAAIVVLSPLIAAAVRQSRQLGWVTRPSLQSVNNLISHFAGIKDLIPLVAALALAGAAADVGRRHRVAWAPAAITLPWLVLPPVFLLAVSELRPVYVERYVVFCTPALALLTAGGLVWLARLAGLTPAGRRFPVLAALPSALLIAIMAAALVAPQQAIRLTSSRTDDLGRVAAVIARNERPGDVVFYMPWNTRVVGLTYPAPFQRLRDIGQLESPVASTTLTGIPVPPALLGRRFVSVPRVWTVRWRRKPQVLSPLYLEQRGLLRRMHLIRHWIVRSVVLDLYGAGR